MEEESEGEIVSLNVINRKAPYQVRFKENQSNVLQFITDKSLIYNITFVVDQTLALSNIFQFVIEEELQTHASHDPKVEQTIIAIADSFFLDKERVLSFVCDTKGSHEVARNLLFHKWFTKYNKKKLLKIDGVVHTEETTFYSSIICNQENTNIEIVKSTYMDLINELQK